MLLSSNIRKLNKERELTIHKNETILTLTAPIIVSGDPTESERQLNNKNNNNNHKNNNNNEIINNNNHDDNNK